MSEAKIRVLIVEDSAPLRWMLQRVLPIYDPDIEVVDLAVDGAEAVCLARQHRPDIVLMDINLPDVSGIEVTETIVKGMPSVRVVLMSGTRDPGAFERAVQVGACQVIMKPFEPTELASILRKIMQLGDDVD